MLSIFTSYRLFFLNIKLLIFFCKYFLSVYQWSNKIFLFSNNFVIFFLVKQRNKAIIFLKYFKKIKFIDEFFINKQIYNLTGTNDHLYIKKINLNKIKINKNNNFFLFSIIAIGQFLLKLNNFFLLINFFLNKNILFLFINYSNLSLFTNLNNSQYQKYQKFFYFNNLLFFNYDWI